MVYGCFLAVYLWGGGIRVVYGGIRVVYGGIRVVYGWYTDGIRMVYDGIWSGALFKEADLKIIPPNHQKLYEAKAP